MHLEKTGSTRVALLDTAEYSFLKEDDTLPKLTDIWGHKFEKSIVCI